MDHATARRASDAVASITGTVTLAGPSTSGTSVQPSTRAWAPLEATVTW